MATGLIVASASTSSLISVAEALDRLLKDAGPLGIENIELRKAQGRTLAANVDALRSQPPFAASAMDGYAVRAEDVVAEGQPLEVVGEVAAGYVLKKAIGQGQCARIFTGAPLPDGADAVLIQENARPIADKQIVATQQVKPGTFVRPAGLDFKQGETLLEHGRKLDAGALSLAASANQATLLVHRKPIVGILATGDELRKPGSQLAPGQIIASNSYGVAAIVEDNAATAIDLGIAQDTRQSLEDALDRAKQAKCDVIITLGGASVGDHDLVQSTFVRAGMELGFWKIAMRPGKPLMFGNLGSTRVLGLPGNPVSSLVCTHLFVVPLLAALNGRTHQYIRQTATLENAVSANGNREQYARAIVRRTSDGFSAKVFEQQDSSILTFYAQANALAIRPINAKEAACGDQIEFIAISEL